MRPFLVALGLGFVMLEFGAPPPAQAQTLASLAATAATAPAANAEQQPGCWGCFLAMYYAACSGGFSPGYWNCSSGGNYCVLSSPGCGGGAALPLDPDGSTQFVSRGSRLGVMAARGASAERRNCEGVVVALRQSSADIERVRTRTGSLTL